MPMVDRLTEEASVTGAVNTLTREGKRLIGHNTDVAGFKVALDKLVGRQKMPRQAVVLGAGGGGRAVVYGLIREGFQRIIVFNRHLHRAEGLVKHFGRTRRAHGAAGDALARVDHRVGAGQDQGPHQRDVDRADQPTPARSRPRPSTTSCWCWTSSTRGPGSCATRRRPARPSRDGELMLLHQGAAAFTLWTGQPAPLELMQAKLAEARAGGLRSAEGEPTGEPAAAAAE